MTYRTALFFALAFIAIAASSKPSPAQASFFSDIGLFFTKPVTSPSVASVASQQVPILQAPQNSGSKVLGTTTRSVDVPAESSVQVVLPAAFSPVSTTTTSVYVVVSGDNLLSIAKHFGLSVSAVKGANNLTTNSIKIGQKLFIPVVGSVAPKATGSSQVKDAVSYSAQAATISDTAPASAVKIPTEPIIIAPAVTKIFSPDGYYLRPIIGGLKTQGIHGHNAVDLAEDCGTPIYASATGTVATADATGWNGGYGGYVKINHSNGSETLYAHMETLMVAAGQSVAQGQQIGAIGHTGEVDKEGGTGCHVHFEIRNNGYANPF